MKDDKIHESRKNRVHSPDYRVVKIRTEGKVGAAKTMLIGIFILLQLGFLIALFLGVISSFVWYFLVAFILSFICCMHVMSSDRNAQSKTVWTLFLLLFFAVGYIFYFISLEKVFFGRAKRRYNKIYSRTEKYEPEYAGNNAFSSGAEGVADFLYNAGGFAPRKADMKYFSSGYAFFEDVYERIKSAEKFIFIEFFIFSDGILLNRFSDILCEKAESGVEVRVIMDGVGSHGTLSRKMRKKLKGAGVKIYSFNPVLPHFSFALNVRDHRKIVVIDGKTAYTGGCNLADEYVNEKRMHGYWKDCGIRADGSAADGFTLTFLRQWEFVAKKTEDYSTFLNSYGEEGSVSAVPYADGKDYKRDICKGVYNGIADGARQKLYIMTPYFIPDGTIADMLAQKALSGVDVRIVLPAVPDKPYVYALTLDNAERLMKYGVKVYKMRHAFVHSKLMLSENCVSVGSANIDLRSFYNQFENGIFTDDKGVCEAVNEDFEKTFALSELITEKTCSSRKFLHRLLAGFLRLFAPLM